MNSHRKSEIRMKWKWTFGLGADIGIVLYPSRGGSCEKKRYVQLHSVPVLVSSTKMPG